MGCLEGKSRDWFLNGISCKVGNGNNVLFLKSNWLRGVPLMFSFPLLFNISQHSNATVREIGSFIKDSWNWNFMGEFKVLLRVELVQVEVLKSILVHVGSIQEVDEKFIWFTNMKGKQQECEGYADSAKLGFSSNLNPNVLEAKISLWKTKVPSKVPIFGWRCIKDIFATKEKLIKGV